VTNQSDKDEQLNKIGKLDRKVRVCVERENQKRLEARQARDAEEMGGDGHEADTGPSRVLAEALRGGSKPWNYAKMMLVGEGRAGKTSCMKTLLGQPFDSKQV